MCIRDSERSTRISSGFTYLSFYVGPCSEHKMDANGTCIYCGASYVASVTASGGESTNYTSLDDALDAMKDGDTVTLLSDAKITRWPSLSKAFTLELNGKTATTQSKAELYLHARVTVQDSSTGKTGGMAGTALLNVQSNGDLIIKSGTFNGRIAMNDGKLTIKGGTFNQEVDLSLIHICQPDAALMTLSPLGPYIKTCGRYIDGIHLNVLTAIALYRKKDERWRERLTVALDAAAEYRFIRTVSVYGCLLYTSRCV